MDKDISNKVRAFVKNDGRLELSQAIRLINDHVCVDSITEIEKVGDSVEITMCFNVELPSRLKRVGVSDNGINSREFVKLEFLNTYPLTAPIFKLRKDFNRSFAHINPGRQDDYVKPCLVFGDINEIFQARGLWFLLDQMVIWFQNALNDNLIDPNLGWEPIRRDSIEGFIAFDKLEVERKININKKKSYKACLASFASSKIMEEDRFNFCVNNQKNETLTALIGKVTKNYISNYCLGNCPVIFTKLNSSVVNFYVPDTVVCVKSLKEFAEKIGCSVGLEEVLSDIRYNVSFFQEEGRLSRFPIVLVFCVKRPYKLVGEKSHIEMIPYLLNEDILSYRVLADDVDVKPLAHRSVVTRELFQKMSMGHETKTNETTLIGCGSLGSKIATHLAREGHCPKNLIDKGMMSPHNYARHALFPRSGLQEQEALSFLGKAHLLETNLQQLGGVCTAYMQDVLEFKNHPKTYENAFPRTMKYVLNVTASLSVREALGTGMFQSKRARIIEASLFSGADLGYLSIEGQKHNPSTTDMIACFYNYVVKNDKSKALNLLSDNNHRMSYLNTGEGCGSLTTIASDAKISMYASFLANKISSWIGGINNPPDVAQMYIGLFDEDTGVNWCNLVVPPLTKIKVENNTLLNVHITQEVCERIEKEVAKYPNVETGGIILGRKSQGSQTFVVNDLLDAPIDSTREQTRFELGVEGREKMIEDYNRKASGMLWYLGTWHSHLTDSMPSALDHQASRELTSLDHRSGLVLIHTPQGYKAIISTKKTQTENIAR